MKKSASLWVFLALGVGNAVANPPSPTPLPPALTDAEITQVISRAQLGILREKRTYISCGWIQRPLSTGTPPDTSTPTGFRLWLQYVAGHVRTAIPFDADYPQIAAAALTNVPPGFGEACLGGPPKDLQKVAVIQNADPAKIGQALFVAFRAYDQDTRNRAATKIEQ